MSLKIAINGFGRIGRLVFREYFKRRQSLPYRIVAINDITDAATMAHLLEYDSVHGRLQANISVKGSHLIVDDQEIQIIAEKDIKNLPWKSLGVDLVLESTGIFTDREKAQIHIDNGAKKVLISAPAKSPDLTVVYGVNHLNYNSSAHNIVSCASCTTNCLAPVAKVLHENFGVIRGTMMTAHSYTNDQRILDLPHKDLRRARSAAVSMIPTTTGAAKAIGEVMPELKGKLDGLSIRVPTPDVSVVDFTCEVARDTSVEEVNRSLRTASENSLKGILGFCEKPLVSVDYIGNTLSSTVDSLCTIVLEKRMVKTLAWYDNEAGFSARMIDVANLMLSK